MAASKKETKRDPWTDLLRDKQDRLKLALGERRPWAAWWETALAWSIRLENDSEVNKKLNENQTRASDYFAAFISAAKAGLMLDGDEGGVYLRGNGKWARVKFEMGYRGVVERAGRAGYELNTGTVKAGDAFEYNEGSAPYLKHQKAWTTAEEPGETLGYYCVCTPRNDERIKVVTMSLSEANERRPKKSTPAWDNWPDVMGEKSCILRAGKVLFYSDEHDDMVRAIDGVIQGDDDREDDDPEHPPRTTKDLVMAEAARKRQDMDTEGPAASGPGTGALADHEAGGVEGEEGSTGNDPPEPEGFDAEFDARYDGVEDGY